MGTKLLEDKAEAFRIGHPRWVLLALAAIAGCGGLQIGGPQLGVQFGSHEAPTLVPLEDIPREIISLCPDFHRLIKACHPGERAWWVIYETSDRQTPSRSLGMTRSGRRRWVVTINSNRVESYCD